MEFIKYKGTWTAKTSGIDYVHIVGENISLQNPCLHVNLDCNGFKETKLFYYTLFSDHSDTVPNLKYCRIIFWLR